MRRLLVAALLLSLLPVHVLAQSPQSPIRQTTERLAAEYGLAQATKREDGGIPPGFLWTGVGLLAAGGLYFALGAAYECGPYDICQFDSPVLSISARQSRFLLGALLAGGGVALLIEGKKKASSKRVSPQLVTTPGGIALNGRIKFSRSPRK